MNNADLPRKPLQVSASSTDDIPEAIRETPDIKTNPRPTQTLLLWVAAGFGALALSSLWFALQAKEPAISSLPQGGTLNSSVLPATAPTEQKPAKNVSDSLLGHFAYQQALEQELEPVVADGSIRLRRAAAIKFRAMIAAAEAAGVSLVPLSGFRSLEEQQYLFFDVQAERGQGAKQRAEVSAPPGYSEHHTGYAVDLGDSNVPATDLSPDFENTAAFKWLAANAVHFNFEMSFPKNNPQGVTYEPWHWRFVGDRNSLETFYKARSPQ